MITELDTISLPSYLLCSTHDGSADAILITGGFIMPFACKIVNVTIAQLFVIAVRQGKVAEDECKWCQIAEQGQA